jgi:hypothetical protein
MMRWFSHARIVQMSDFCNKFFKAAGAGFYAPKYLEGLNSRKSAYSIVHTTPPQSR